MSETISERHERMTREHHQACYNKDKFKWEWCTIDHLGIWAFGGIDKKSTPYFLNAKFCVPQPDNKKEFGWYCYIGPQPEFISTNLKDCFEEWVKSKDSKKPSWSRRGQWMFNELDRLMPTIADEVRGNDEIDAFYVDARIDKMVEYVKKRCETTEV